MAVSLIAGALILLLLPLEWIISCLIAALIHELGHYCAVLLMGGSVHGIKVGAVGTIMDASGLTPKREMVCLLAGPLAGLLTIITIRAYPAVALCGLIQSLYNLLPVYPLDGGRLMKNYILMHGGTDRLFHKVEHFVLVLLFLLSVFVRIRFGISLFLFFGVLLFRKTPCKPFRDWI